LSIQKVDVFASRGGTRFAHSPYSTHKERAMKKQAATDAKKAAADDKPENCKATKAKRAKAPDDARYAVGNLTTVKRGFLLAVCEFVKAKGEVDHAMLVKEFSGRQFDSRKVGADRITRYLSYCRNHGLLKVVKKAGGQ